MNILASVPKAHAVGKRLLNEFCRNASGAPAVEFAFLAPVLLAALLAMADLGQALAKRMEIDHVLRAGAQIAMEDPGLARVQEVIAALSDLDVQIALHCPCPDDQACTVPCAEGASHVAYRLSAVFTYESMITPLELPLSSSMEVRVR